MDKRKIQIVDYPSLLTAQNQHIDSSVFEEMNNLCTEYRMKHNDAIIEKAVKVIDDNWRNWVHIDGDGVVCFKFRNEFIKKMKEND